jgi:hypothetical protein
MQVAHHVKRPLSLKALGMNKQGQGNYGGAK